MPSNAFINNGFLNCVTSILITGGAYFIVTNFVRDWMPGSDVPVIKLDKLTYAGIRKPIHWYLDNSQWVQNGAYTNLVSKQHYGRSA